jgi:hypothetical protein
MAMTMPLTTELFSTAGFAAGFAALAFGATTVATFESRGQAFSEAQQPWEQAVATVAFAAVAFVAVAQWRLEVAPTTAKAAASPTTVHTPAPRILDRSIGFPFGLVATQVLRILNGNRSSRQRIAIGPQRMAQPRGWLCEMANDLRKSATPGGGRQARGRD